MPGPTPPARPPDRPGPALDPGARGDRTVPRRWAWLGLAGLAGLAVGQWLRESGLAGAAPDWLAGSWPNLAAAFAIPFVWLSCLLDIDPTRADRGPREWRTMAAGLAVAGIGLTAWETVQLALPRARFDPLDLAATGVGLALAALAFRLGRRPR